MAMAGEKDPVRAIAQAVLYEGYLLWPYRKSALKNQQRWTFGGVYPQPYSEARGGDDPWLMQSQCLLERGPAQRGAVATGAVVSIQVRFLHVVQRDVARQSGAGLEMLDQLTVAGQRYLSWEESTEREIITGHLDVAELLGDPHSVEIDIPAGEHTEWLPDESGEVAGAIVRSWQAIHGTVDIGAELVGPDLYRLTITISNGTPFHNAEREQALRRTMVSTHTVITAMHGRMVSLLDPPQRRRAAAEECRHGNIGTWPVLVGTEGEEHMMLSSPIILYDYPEVAPESPGDLFDATEIDQLLTLNILALTDEEQREARDTDPRARQILDRSTAMESGELMRLHGTMRDVRTIGDQGGGP